MSDMISSVLITVLFAALINVSSCGIFAPRKRNNIQYTTNALCSHDEIAKILQSYSDAVRLAQFTLADGGALGEAPNDLVSRFFGTEAVGTDSDVNAQIREIFSNIGSWWPVPFFDWLTGYTINFSCNDVSSVCTPNAGGYAENLENGPLITLCPAFFGDSRYPSLDERKQYLDANPAMQKNLRYFGTSAMLLLHEMIHLQVTSGVSDHVDFTGSENITFFGGYRSEWLADTDQSAARRNADNYAMFANANWFGFYYGIPEPATSSNGFLCTDDIFDVGDIPFANGNITYILNNGSTIETSAWGPVGYTEDASEISSLVNTVASFTQPPNTPQTSAIVDAALSTIAGKTMKILPLGDSITNGYQSTDGNGYREVLFSSLSGNTVTMVGSLESGTMVQNSNEGIDGAVISQIAADATAALLESLNPNIVLLHAGTNDMNNPTDPFTAPARLGSLIDQIVNSCPDAVVLVAQIIPSGIEVTMANIVQYNIGVESEVLQRVQAGDKAIIVDMSHLLNDGDYADTLHPNDSGYAKMASAWLEGIALADQAGWIGGGGGTTTVVTTKSMAATSVTLTSPTTSQMPTSSTPATPTASAICVPIPSWIAGQNATGEVVCTSAGPPNGIDVCSCFFEDQGVFEFVYSDNGDCADLSVSNTTCGFEE